MSELKFLSIALSKSHFTKQSLQEATKLMDDDFNDLFEICINSDFFEVNTINENSDYGIAYDYKANFHAQRRYEELKANSKANFWIVVRDIAAIIISIASLIVAIIALND